MGHIQTQPYVQVDGGEFLVGFYCVFPLIIDSLANNLQCVSQPVKPGCSSELMYPYTLSNFRKYDIKIQSKSG